MSDETQRSDERQSDTSIPIVALGGALSSVLLYLAGPALEAVVGERPPPGLEAALATLITAGIAWRMPARLGR
jgi:hypothetical protein